MLQVVRLPKRTPLAYEWIVSSTFGHQRSRGRDRVFAHGALTNRVFADGIFANRRGGGGNRLRPWHVSSNCCSHESQRSDTKNHEFQHRVLTMIRVGWNSPDTHRNNLTLATTAMNRPRSRQFRQLFLSYVAKMARKLRRSVPSRFRGSPRVKTCRDLPQSIHGKTRPVRAIYSR
jgi:hypothetical protein